MENEMSIDGLKQLEISHIRAREILDISASKYWSLVRGGLIQVVGWGRGSRAVFSTVEAYHRARLTAPKKQLPVTMAQIKRGQARAAGLAAQKANEETAAT
jgi:hypothetical protein